MAGSGAKSTLYFLLLHGEGDLSARLPPCARTGPLLSTALAVLVIFCRAPTRARAGGRGVDDDAWCSLAGAGGGHQQAVAKRHAGGPVASRLLTGSLLCRTCADKQAARHRVLFVTHGRCLPTGRRSVADRRAEVRSTWTAYRRQVIVWRCQPLAYCPRALRPATPVELRRRGAVARSLPRIVALAWGGARARAGRHGEADERDPYLQVRCGTRCMSPPTAPPTRAVRVGEDRRDGDEDRSQPRSRG